MPWTDLAGSFGPWAAVKFTSPADGIVVGLGQVKTTTTGGASWDPIDPGTSVTSVQLRDVDAIGSQAWAVGDYGVIITTTIVPGGATVPATPQTSGTSENLAGVHFIDPNTGWVVGTNGTILATPDGGMTWVPQANPDPGLYDLLDVNFFNACDGWIVGRNGMILATTNGGAKWVLQHSGTTALLFAVKFTDPCTGFAVGERGTILSTINGGKTWVPQVSPTTTAILLDVDFVDPITGWVVGSEDTILATNTGGTAWLPQNDPGGSPQTENLIGVSFPDAYTGYAVGSRAIKYT